MHHLLTSYGSFAFFCFFFFNAFIIELAMCRDVLAGCENAAALDDYLHTKNKCLVSTIEGGTKKIS